MWLDGIDKMTHKLFKFFLKYLPLFHIIYPTYTSLSHFCVNDLLASENIEDLSYEGYVDYGDIISLGVPCHFVGHWFRNN